MGSARAAAARGLRSAPRLTLGRAPRRTEPGLPPGSVGAGPGPGCEGPRRLARPRRGLLDPDAAGEASRRAPSRGAGVPGLAGRAQARAAGRRRADSGALRARRGSHSDEIPVPGQRHQPASAFLLPSQIETEGGGREVGKKKKKKATSEGGREEGRSPGGGRPDPLVATSAFPRGPAPGAPQRRDPAPGPRAGRAPRIRRGKQGLIKLERNFSQLLMNRRLGLCSGLEGSGLRSEPACGGGAEPRRASQAGPPPSAPSHLRLLVARGRGALARGPCSPPLSLSLSLFL